VKDKTDVVTSASEINNVGCQCGCRSLSARLNAAPFSGQCERGCGCDCSRRCVTEQLAARMFFTGRGIASLPYEKHLTISKKSSYESISLRSAVFWDITQRRVVVLYRRFGTSIRSHLQGPRSPSLEYGTDGLSLPDGTEQPLYAA
jgi:hypothetical protein